MTKWNKDMPSGLLKSMKKGHSFQAACIDLDVSTTIGNKWCKKYPAFAEAKEKGNQYGLRLLEQYLLAAITGYMPESLKKHGSKRFNLTGIIFALKTRHHEIYGDKMKLEGVEDDGKKININFNYQKPEKKKKVKK